MLRTPILNAKFYILPPKAKRLQEKKFRLIFTLTISNQNLNHYE